MLARRRHECGDDLLPVDGLLSLEPPVRRLRGSRGGARLSQLQEATNSVSIMRPPCPPIIGSTRPGGPKIAHGGFLVSTHESAITGDVGGEDGSQPAESLRVSGAICRHIPRSVLISRMVESTTISTLYAGPEQPKCRGRRRAPQGTSARGPFRWGSCVRRDFRTWHEAVDFRTAAIPSALWGPADAASLDQETHFPPLLSCKIEATR
jgi:hypothetical protein